MRRAVSPEALFPGFDSLRNFSNPKKKENANGMISYAPYQGIDQGI
jgi:hypothetical protein